MKYLILIVFLIACSAQAVTRTVDASGGADHTTVGAAYTAASNGDRILILNSNLYNETISVAKELTFQSTNWAIIRGFDILATNNIKILGLQITHTSSSRSRAITISGVSSNIIIQGNWIHNIYGDQCIQGNAGASPWNVVIRDNLIYEIRWVFGVETNCSRQCIGSDSGSHHWLVEYNHIYRSGDFCNLYGADHIVRNNFFHDYKDSYCAEVHTHTHSDMFQPGSDGLNAAIRRHVYENNFLGDSTEPESHGGLFQDNQHATVNTDTNILYRGQIFWDIGDSAIGGFGTDKINTYNNTAYNLCMAKSGGSIIYFNNTTSGSLGVGVKNWIIYKTNMAGTDFLRVISPGILWASNNIGYLAGTHTSYISTSDPSFVNGASLNFRLQAGSPAINTGCHIAWITTANGSGTSFDVNDSQSFNDGKGICEGDIVTINGTTTRILSISGDTVTVRDSVTWTQNMPIYWLTDTTPDIGALPFDSTLLSAATYTQNGNDYLVTTTGDARGVWFYTNGIPSQWIYEKTNGVYKATVTAGTVSMKAYALYAQTNLTILATLAGTDYVPHRGKPGNNIRVRAR